MLNGPLGECFNGGDGGVNVELGHEGSSDRGYGSMRKQTTAGVVAVTLLRAEPWTPYLAYNIYKK